ncbi:outer membrane beta-barrel protein [Luteirhabdus pelagi]|uniref:outer membrane beta-barrel protein n=1 Tax=Luteirhabdus pelagi TaxID=2792783 RepID=UPI001939871E|nr:outer membrane beta-barrel protein [Luteirhabdus pelagi]
MNSSFLIICFSLFSFASWSQNQLLTAEDSLGYKYREDQFYIGITYNIPTNVPSGVNARGLSGGIHFGYLRDMPLNERRNVALAVGVGMTLDQYGQNLFIGETEDEETIFTILTNEINFDQNRFSTAAVEVPLEFRWRSSTATTYQFWRIYAGVRAGYTYWYRSYFQQPGNAVSQTDIPEFNQFRMRATLSFGYGSINFFASYSLQPFFENAVTTDGQNIDLRTFRAGLIFYLL